MKRRDLVASGLSSAVFLTPGCLSSISTPVGDTPTPTLSAKEECSDRKFPKRHLGIIELITSDRPDNPSPIIRFDALPPAEQSIVEQAIEQGRYKICLPEAREAEVTAFTALVERIKDHTSSVPDGAYLKYEKTYYQFTHVRTRDQIFVTAQS